MLPLVPIDTIWDLASSKDGKLFASVSGDDIIKLRHFFQVLLVA